MTNKEKELPKDSDSKQIEKIKNHPYSSEEQKALHDILHKTYPIINAKNPKPLAIGIFKDLQEKSGLPKERLQAFFKWYCGRKYRTTLKAGQPRYNLNGEIVGEVTPEQEVFFYEKFDVKNLTFILDRLFFILVAKGQVERLSNLLQAGFKPSKNVDLVTLAKKLNTHSEEILNVLTEYNLYSEPTEKEEKTSDSTQ